MRARGGHYERFTTLFQKIFHSSPAAMALSRLSDGHFLEANESFSKLTGYALNEVTGLTATEADIMADPKKREERLATLNQGHQVPIFEVEVIRKSGEIRNCIATVGIVSIQDEQYTLSTLIDVTERTLAEKQVIQMKRLYATLSHVNETIVRSKNRAELYQSICKVAVQFGEFSLAWVGLLDEPSNQVISVAADGQDETQWPFQTVDIEEGALKDELVATAIHTSKVATSDDIRTDIRMQSLRDQLSEYDYHSSAVIPFRLRGRTIGVVNLISREVGLFKTESEALLLEEMGGDISFALDTIENETEHKLAEEALHESQKLLQDVIDNSPSLIYALDKEGHFVLANQKVESLFGVADGQLIGKTRSIALPPEIAEQHRNNDLQVIHSRQAQIFEEENLEADGKHFYLTHKFPIMNTDNQVYAVCGTSTDITERKQGEAALLESELRFRLLFQNLNSGFALHEIICDAQGKPCDYRFLEINSAFEMLTGLKAPELIGKTVLQVLPNTEPAWIDRYGQVALTGTPIHFESFSTALGKYYEVNAYSPKAGQFATVFLDVTERKQAEETVRQSERQMKALVTSLDDIVFEVDEQETYLNIWTSDERLLIQPKSQMLGRRIVEVLGEEKSRPFIEAVQRVLATGKPENVEYPLEVVGGQRWFLARVSPIFAHDDSPRTASMLVRDITERKQAEKKIQLQLRRISALNDIDRAIGSSFDMRQSLDILLNEVLAQLDVDAASILLLNPFNQKLEYIAGKGFRTLNIRQSNSQLGNGLAGRVGLERKVLHVPNLAEIGGQFQRRVLLKDEKFVEYFGIPLIAKGTLKGVLEVFHRTSLNPDLDWLNYLETLGGQAAIAIDNAQLFDGLQRSNAELEQRVKLRTADLLLVNAELKYANRAKDEFLANMSHELRTPLTGILGLTESLQLNTYGQPNEKQSNALKNIEASGYHLLELINDILDLSKIESNKFDIYPEMIDIEETCRASLIFVREQANKKSILLEYQEAKDVKLVFADPRRLKQILVNLLSNAVKFTPEKGKVTLAVCADSENGQIHFAVTDTGIGITKEDLDRLFTPFTQVDSSLNRQYEGTGLGLVLVLRLAEMHGGNVQVETDLGQGSCFTVSLPWRSQVNTPIETQQININNEAPVETVPTSQGVVLLAEDNSSNIEAIGDYLQFKGYTLMIASNGAEAILKAEENNPDLILMDIQMPVMDGLEAMRRLRADPRFISTPIIALTALAMTGDRERCLEAGATDYLSKPVSLKGLTEKIKILLQR